MSKWIIGIFTVLVLLWLGSLIDFLAATLALSPLLIIPTIIGGLWFSLNRSQKTKFLAALNQYRWFWVIPAWLAMITTTLIGMASYLGLAVRYFDWGLRGTPWGYVYFWNFVVWLLAILAVCLCHKAWRDNILTYFVFWVKSGGCWKIFSTDNRPANRLLGLYAIVLTIALLYGWPSPPVDPEMQIYETKTAIREFSDSDFATRQKDRIDDWSESLFGHEVFTSDQKEQTLKRPELRFVRSWFWLKLSFFLSPLGFLGLILSRRDGAATFFEWLLVSWFRKKPEILTGEAKSEEQAVKTDEEPTESKAPEPAITVHRPNSFGDLLKSDLIAEATVRTIERILENSAKWLKRAT